jgi:hypothetical protein
VGFISAHEAAKKSFLIDCTLGKETKTEGNLHQTCNQNEDVQEIEQSIEQKARRCILSPA